MTHPTKDALDRATTNIYRIFKGWEGRKFTADDVTWCEVRAEIEKAMSAAMNVDVEGLKREIEAKHGADDITPDMAWAGFVDGVAATIDHLAATGRLSQNIPATSDAAELPVDGNIAVGTNASLKRQAEPQDAAERGSDTGRLNAGDAPKDYKHPGHLYTAAEDFAWLRDRIYGLFTKKVWIGHPSHVCAAVFNLSKALGMDGYYQKPANYDEQFAWIDEMKKTETSDPNYEVYVDVHNAAIDAVKERLQNMDRGSDEIL